jgi:D-glycero-alpha-D-manno-heptose-7-phosphate kinase
MFYTSRTPLRVSLFGGGSDYPEWYRRRPGAVLGFTIDKYIYISALRLTTFVDYRYRLTYSRLEVGNDIAEIQHPVVRAVLTREEFSSPMDYSIQADLPANAGLGSSSAFTVGFLGLITSLKGVSRTKLELAELAIDIEQNVLKERVGIQDQLHAAFGGLNHFTFEGDRFGINPVHVSGADLDRLADWLVLVYTGVKRHASEVLQAQVANTVEQRVDGELEAMVALVDEGHRVLESAHGDDLPIALARLLDESWRLKKRLSPNVSSPEIDDLYERCRRAGALAGKLCGAGSGGFLLMVVPPDRRAALCHEFGADRCIAFRIEQTGSVVSHRW